MMECPRCKVDMRIGQAISPHPHRHNFSFVIIPADEVKMIDVYKCPKCGHSEDMKDITTCRGVENHNEERCHCPWIGSPGVMEKLKNV